MNEGKSNFADLAGWEYQRFGDIFLWVEGNRQVLGYGAALLADEHALLERQLALLIAKNWERWEPGQRWHSTGDRGGFLGFGEQDPLGVARRALRPIKVASDLLQEAQNKIVKFPRAFNQWMEPYRSPLRPPAPRRGEFRDQPGRGNWESW